MNWARGVGTLEGIQLRGCLLERQCLGREGHAFKSRDLLRTLPKVYDGAFCKNSSRLLKASLKRLPCSDLPICIVSGFNSPYLKSCLSRWVILVLQKGYVSNKSTFFHVNKLTLSV